jgi:putative restriction endonuclease
MLAYRLYCELPFGKMHKGNPRVVEMARRLDRSPSSIALRLVNFAHLDPAERARGVSGMGNVSALDREVVTTFANDWDAAVAQTSQQWDVASEAETPSAIETRETEGTASVKVRLTQGFFRRAVLAAYDSTCCVCGISTARLLVASHLVPWAAAPAHRTNPRNGLTLCALHDRAFDTGLLTVTPSYVIRISDQLQADVPVARAAFADVSGSQIRRPTRFTPAAEFLTFHNKSIFLGGPS